MKTYIDIFNESNDKVIAVITQKRKVLACFGYSKRSIFESQLRYWVMPPEAVVRWNKSTYKGKTTPLKRG